MSLDYSAIGKQLQSRHRANGKNQEALAEQAGITTVYLSKIENGRVHATLDLLDNSASFYTATRAMCSRARP